MTTTCEADPVDAGDFCFFLLSLSPSDDPLLVLSLLFPSFFLLFPEDSELVDLLLALSFKEMFRLTGCDADPWFAPSCSSSRSNTKGSKSFHFLTKSIATLDVGEAK